MLHALALYYSTTNEFNLILNFKNVINISNSTFLRATNILPMQAIGQAFYKV